MGRLSDSFGTSGELDLRVRCSNDHLSEMVTKKLDDNLKSFTSRVSGSISNIYLGLDLKKNSIRVKGIPQYECKINLTTDQGNFYATEISIGAVGAVNGCLSNLETQIEKKKAKYYSRAKSRDKESYLLSEYEEN